MPNTKLRQKYFRVLSLDLSKNYHEVIKEPKLSGTRQLPASNDYQVI